MESLAFVKTTNKDTNFKLNKCKVTFWQLTVFSKTQSSSFLVELPVYDYMCISRSILDNNRL